MWLRLFRPKVLTERNLVFETASVTSAGGRPENQDAVGHRSCGGATCWVLADGLGGHLGGQVASRTAVDAVLRSFEKHTAAGVHTHLESANRAVLQGQQTQPELAQMRTTIAALVATGDAARWAHCGDSRVYFFRDGAIQDRTLDHSVPQRLVEAGEIGEDQIRFHEDRARLLHCLGSREQLTAPEGGMEGAPEPGDAFLLASDGFWEYVLESEMEQDARASKSCQAWIDAMEARVKVRAQPDYDNYSAIVVRVTAGRI
jgi:serine/threonine protein phosphatase PrpC